MRITIQRNGTGRAGARKPVYQQIAEQVNAAISTGQLRHGDKLPTIRALAGELGVNRDTVALAYALQNRAPCLPNKQKLQGRSQLH